MNATLTLPGVKYESEDDFIRTYYFFNNGPHFQLISSFRTNNEKYLSASVIQTWNSGAVGQCPPTRTPPRAYIKLFFVSFFPHTLHLFLHLLHRWHCQDLFFLSLSLPECVTLWSMIIPVHVRQREVRRKKKKKAQKKSLHHDRDLNPQTLSPEPSVLSIRPRRPTLTPSILRTLFDCSQDFDGCHFIFWQLIIGCLST